MVSPVLHNDPLGDTVRLEDILVPKNPNGDQTGLIRNATVEEKATRPVYSFFKDLFHGVMATVGLNAVDDISADVRQRNDNDDLDMVSGTKAALGVIVAVPAGDKEKKVSRL